VVAFDTVVRVLGGVVKRGQDETFDRRPSRGCPVGHDFDGFAMRVECRGEEPSCCSEIASGRDEHVDDMTVLINRSVDVTPFAGDLHVRLVDVPTVTDRVAARARGIREEWREALDPPVDADVVDLDATLTEQDVAVGQPVPQIPAHGEDDDLRRESEALER
jgi:hypothetical protein